MLRGVNTFFRLLLSVPVLFVLGCRTSRPECEAALPSHDLQQTRLIDLVLKDLSKVPLNRKERSIGSRDFRISIRTSNPAKTLVLPKFWFPHGKAAMHEAVFGPRRHLR